MILLGAALAHANNDFARSEAELDDMIVIGEEGSNHEHHKGHTAQKENTKSRGVRGTDQEFDREKVKEEKIEKKDPYTKVIRKREVYENHKMSSMKGLPSADVGRLTAVPSKPKKGGEW